MELKKNKVLGLVGSPEAVNDMLSAISIPTEHYKFDSNEELPEDITVIQYMEICNKEVAPMIYDKDTLLGFLELSELDNRLNETIKNLSEGEKRRLQFLRAMLSNRYFYVISELFHSMDKNDISILTKMLIKMSTYAAMILISENDEGFEVCSRVIKCDE